MTAWASRALGSVGSSSDLCSWRHTRRPPKPEPSSGARCVAFTQSMPAPSADMVAVHARYTRDRQIGECSGHQRSQPVPRNAGQPASPAATRHHFRRRARVRVSSPRLPGARRGLAHEPVGNRGRASPAGLAGSRRRRCEHRRSRQPCYPHARRSGPTFRQYGGQFPMMLRLGPGLVLRPVRSRRCRR